MGIRCHIKRSHFQRHDRKTKKVLQYKYIYPFIDQLTHSNRRKAAHFPLPLFSEQSESMEYERDKETERSGSGEGHQSSPHPSHVLLSRGISREVK